MVSRKKVAYRERDETPRRNTMSQKIVNINGVAKSHSYREKVRNATTQQGDAKNVYRNGVAKKNHAYREKVRNATTQQGDAKNVM